ncbi:MAG: hypothetical protein LBP21_08030 [Synergistaceae bacterium]|jgi:hypothetical protein|nr:hypothetical protein [Synergistaceae bacterium]
MKPSMGLNRGTQTAAKKGIVCALLAAAVFFAAFPAFGASIEERILNAWTRKGEYNEGSGLQSVALKVTYYSAEYIEALVRSEAEKNLWTKDEEERYKYNLLKTLNLEECIAFHVDFNTSGTPVFLQPFGRHLKLYAGKKILEPVDYDKRFNFKLQGQRDGMIWFPRYDEKTGKNLLEGVKELRLLISGSISQATTKTGDIRFVWNITGDDPSTLNAGTAASRLELDRLIKRLEKLSAEKSALQQQMDAIDKELSEIDNRVDELQRQ